MAFLISERGCIDKNKKQEAEVVNWARLLLYLRKKQYFRGSRVKFLKISKNLKDSKKQNYFIANVLAEFVTQRDSCIYYSCNCITHKVHGSCGGIKH